MIFLDINTILSLHEKEFIEFLPSVMCIDDDVDDDDDDDDTSTTVGDHIFGAIFIY